VLATDPAPPAGVPGAVEALAPVLELADSRLLHMRAVGGLTYATSHLANEADRLLTALASTEAETALEAACRTWLVDAVTLARTALEEERRALDAMTGGRS